MSLLRDRQIRRYGVFLVIYSFLLFFAGIWSGISQARRAGEMYIAHNEGIAAFLLDQGVSGTTIVDALVHGKSSSEGRELLAMAGIHDWSEFTQLKRVFLLDSAVICIFFAFILLGASLLFLRQRNRLYEQADEVIGRYLKGDFSCRLPQNGEGAVCRLFSSVDQMAARLRSQSEAEHKAREFLKGMISDLSHQLKTPLTALSMYQEILEQEPENEETVREFSQKMGTSVRRMEQLVQSVLKLARLDAGVIVFEKTRYPVRELVSQAVRELLIRAKKEGKRISITGDPELHLDCDGEWTVQAIGNIVKNALDHTPKGGHIHIGWKKTPDGIQILISDDGEGIPQEDIYHIFKRFYRGSSQGMSQGTGLGLPLAKSIVEGQGGLILAESEEGRGTVFTLSFLTEL